MSSLDHGSLFIGSITRIEPFGLYLVHQGFNVFVHLPEVSWVPNPNWARSYSVGGGVLLKVIGYNYEQRHYIASIRRAHPNNNPYRDLFLAPPGHVFEGRVTSVAPEVFVALSNGCEGILLNSAQSKFRGGDAVMVTINSLWVELPSLEFSLAG